MMGIRVDVKMVTGVTLMFTVDVKVQYIVNQPSLVILFLGTSVYRTYKHPLVLQTK